jgi:1-deoxy-D-xylulose-5-phosphate reductoisomerase
VELFLSGKIKFTDIFATIKEVMERHETINEPTLDDIIKADTWARTELNSLYS